MKKRPVSHLATIAGLLVLACAGPTHAADDPRVRVSTTLGDFVIELNPERAPLTVADFLTYVKEGHYTNTLFHRVIANFMIQGGGVTTEYTLKPAHPPIPNESGNGLENVRGAVGLARAAAPHSGDAQFFVNVGNNADLDPLPTRWGYAVFGRVVEGMDVVDRISVQPTGAVGALKSDAPLTPVVIKSIELIGVPSATTPAAPALAPVTTPAEPPPPPPGQ